MALIEVNAVSYAHPGGSELFSDVSFRVANGRHAALIGANGAGKTTLLQLIAGTLRPTDGSVFVDGSVQLMPQAIGTAAGAGAEGTATARPSASSWAGSGPRGWPPPPGALVDAERANDADPSEATGIALAEAVGQWGELGGYHEEARWDACCHRVLRQTFDEARDRPRGRALGR